MKNSTGSNLNMETLAVHAGRRTDPATGAVTPPIHLSTTFERGPDGQYPLGFSYAREGNPARQSLEECLAALEGGKEALAFSSGLAVATALLQGLEPGDHIIAPDDVYYGLRQLIGGVFAKWPLETSYVDMTDVAAVRAAVRPNTRLVLIETPSNPLMKITDLAALAQIAREAKAISVCDGTFTTPVLQRPLDWGIDMVWHSTTKYIGGHSDMTGGALITRYDNYLFERARKSLLFGGAAPSPFDCWLALRGVSTLPWRVRAHCGNALAVAEFLERHPAVERVHYPGMPGHPGHEAASRQMSAWGGMLSFQVRGGREAAMKVAARVRLFTRATSLGGTHSLIEHRASIEGRDTKTPQNLLRASIGLENADDLITDLQQALSLESKIIPYCYTLVFRAGSSRRRANRLYAFNAVPGESMSDEELKAELERLKAENEALKQRGRGGPGSIKVSEKGGVSVYGLGRFPVTLYKEQWEKLLAMASEIKAFIAEHDSQLKRKE